MKKKYKIINKKAFLLIIGFLLVSFSLVLLSYNKFLEAKNIVFAEIKSKIYKESFSTGEAVEKTEVSIVTEEIEDEKSEENKNTTSYDYTAFLEISKLDLKLGLVDINSPYNSVDYNVEILKTSTYPDISSGNFILAAHSGSGYLAYFKDIYKLSLGDRVDVYYNNYKYTYILSNSYLQTKKGSLNIYRDLDKTALTLITCTYLDKKTQTVYILYLDSINEY